MGNGNKWYNKIPVWVVTIGLVAISFFGGMYLKGERAELKSDFMSTRLTNNEALAQSNKEEINKLKTNDEVAKEQMKALCELPKEVKDLTNRITKLEEMLYAYFRFRGFSPPQVKK